MKETIDDIINASVAIHAKLIEKGIPALQALKIAFGAKFAYAATEIINSNIKTELNTPRVSDFLIFPN